jgi:hypothetical protein
MTINNERLFHFANPNGCWHKLEFDTTAMINWANAWVCKHCGKRFISRHNNDNPSYSTSPADRERLLEYLMGKEEMWAAFWKHQWYRQDIPVMYDFQFVAWLTLPLDGVPRWVSLLSEWLGMDKVRDKFGWVECPDAVFDDSQCETDLRGMCPHELGCNDSGRIRAEVAKER